MSRLCDDLLADKSEASVHQHTSAKNLLTSLSLSLSLKT